VMPDGNVKVVCPTHQTIANQIGSSREAVTKAVKSLVSNGLIIVKGREVFISPRQFEIL
jgi:DNA-binding GntR family transcriptional regulator